jgi:hypothetical protein
MVGKTRLPVFCSTGRLQAPLASYFRIERWMHYNINLETDISAEADLAAVRFEITADGIEAQGVREMIGANLFKPERIRTQTGL